jgi:(1->4)-alpha-D-glucan 1-alpha-D-glucosylmutase
LRRTTGAVAAPNAADLAMLLQMIVGAWPLDLSIDDSAGRAAFAQRLAAWQEKALREAKLATDWGCPNEAYENAAREVLIGLVEKRAAPDLLKEICAFANRISASGAVNGLAQVLLKLTVPGVPDLYQGTDYWDFSLVDPDNRRPVDFAARASSLGSREVDDLLADWRDGGIKQAIIARALGLRRDHPALFRQGRYEPIGVEGALAAHVVAFARRHDTDIAITAVPRLAHGFRGDGKRITFEAAAWKGTRLKLDSTWPVVWRNIFNERTISAGEGALDAGAIFASCPVALLVASG